MKRIVTVGAAQLGPIARTETRRDAVGRMIALLDEAKKRGCDLVVFPEAALTAFFPHWYMEDPAEIDSYFEREMPGPETKALFERARQHGIGFSLGYCELAREGGRTRRFNTQILVDGEGNLVGKYRKIHLPGHADHRPGQPYQNLEKRYFEVGDLGFPVWRAFGGVIGMMICNDRRWPESYRVMGLQGVEMILLGYNTPDQSPQGRMEPPHMAMFHHLLSLQAGAYQNATWVVASAKAGTEEGVDQIGGTVIVAPTGEIAARALGEGDELVTAACDLGMGNWLKETTFDFARHRRPEHYRLIVERTGAVPPPKR
jgi:predicted amidohydrolase